MRISPENLIMSMSVVQIIIIHKRMSRLQYSVCASARLNLQGIAS
jgi:hypothetical protein